MKASSLQLFGIRQSAYVRIVQLVLEEKGVDYQLTEVDPFSADGVPDWYANLHPFKKVPLLIHNGFGIYETGAICRYIDERFAGNPLQPTDVKARARMNQFISVCDRYAYRSMVWQIYVETVEKRENNEETDTDVVQAGLDNATKCLEVFDASLITNKWLVHEKLTLADLYAAPIIDYLRKSKQGGDLFQRFPKLVLWWKAVEELASWNRIDWATS